MSIERRLQQYDTELQGKHLSFNKIWRVTFLLTLGTAIMGIGVFLYATVYGIILTYREYFP